MFFILKIIENKVFEYKFKVSSENKYCNKIYFMIRISLIKIPLGDSLITFLAFLLYFYLFFIYFLYLAALLS